MSVYITNAFSINFLVSNSVTAAFEKVTPEEVSDALQVLETRYGVLAENVIGHPDIDRLARDQIGWRIAGERKSISVESGDTLYVAQYRGPRLPEGTTELPEGATIEWWLVQL